MRFFVTGVNGQLGHDIIKELAERGYEAVGSGTLPAYGGNRDISGLMRYVQLDITDKEKVNSVLSQVRPDAVIHCAAWTDADTAEDKPQLCRLVNKTGTENIALTCKNIDSKMIYISSDYVFDGSGTAPWKPDGDSCRPLNVYGQTKLEGELAVGAILERYFIVRISWVFGSNGNNFVKTILNKGKVQNEIMIVNDQIGTPTYTYDLSKLLVDMAESDKYGCYHVSNEGGYISWYDFACEIFRQSGSGVKIVPVTSKEYTVSKAQRPLNSRFDKTKLVENGFRLLPPWQDALKRYLNEIKDLY